MSSIKFSREFPGVGNPLAAGRCRALRRYYTIQISALAAQAGVPVAALKRWEGWRRHVPLSWDAEGAVHSALLELAILSTSKRLAVLREAQAARQRHLATGPTAAETAQRNARRDAYVGYLGRANMAREIKRALEG